VIGEEGETESEAEGLWAEEKGTEEVGGHVWGGRVEVDSEFGN